MVVISDVTLVYWALPVPVSSQMVKLPGTWGMGRFALGIATVSLGELPLRLVPEVGSGFSVRLYDVK
jgi:hypothetical protein